MSLNGSDVERTDVGHWPAGVSGNPGGYSKEKRQVLARLQELAREHVPSSIAKIVALRDDPKSSRAIQLAAANALLDRGLGKPAQTVFTPDIPPPSEFDRNDIEAARRMAFILAKGLRAQVQEQQERVTATDAHVGVKTSRIEESTNGEDSR